MPPGRPGPWAATSSFLGVDADRTEALGNSAGVARSVQKTHTFCEFQDITGYVAERSGDFDTIKNTTRYKYLLQACLKYLAMLNNVFVQQFGTAAIIQRVILLFLKGGWLGSSGNSAQGFSCITQVWSYIFRRVVSTLLSGNLINTAVAQPALLKHNAKFAQVNSII